MKIKDKDDFFKKFNDKEWFCNHSFEIYNCIDVLVNRTLFGDKEVALAILDINWWYIGLFSKKLRDDEEIIEKALRNIGIEDRMRIGDIIECASPRIRKNIELLEKYKCPLKVFPRKMHDDKNLAMRLILEGRGEYKDCSLRLRKMSKFLPFCKDFNDLPDEYKNDKELLKKVLINSNFHGISDFPEEYKSDKNFLLDALALSDNKHNFINCVANIDKNLLDDFDFMEIVLKQSGHCLSYASDRIKNDRKLVEIAINSFPKSLIFCSKKFIESNDDLVEKTIELLDGNLYGIIDYLPNKYFRVKEYAMKIAGTEDTFFKLSDELKKDPDIQKAWGINGDCFEYTYYWYHGFYTKKEREAIREALENKDYDGFMKIYETNCKGLPERISVWAEDTYIGDIDIRNKENFLKITYNESEAG